MTGYNICITCNIRFGETTSEYIPISMCPRCFEKHDDRNRKNFGYNAKCESAQSVYIRLTDRPAPVSKSTVHYLRKSVAKVSGA